MQKKDDKEGNKTACQRETPRKKKESEQNNQNRFAKKTFYVSQILAHVRARKSKEVLDFVR